MTRHHVALLSAPLLACCAHGQSLFLVHDRPSADAPGVVHRQIDASQVSLLWVPEPETRIFQKHDIITIIIDETSSQTSSQKLETEKDASTSMRLDAMIDYMQLLELRLEQGDTSGLELINATAQREFNGEGDYERKDKFSARITATVLETKPNGTLVLEATKRITKDDEIQTIVLSGLVREEDITRQNTVLSSQMANLNITLQNEGELRDAAKKGILTVVLEAVFAF